MGVSVRGWPEGRQLINSDGRYGLQQFPSYIEFDEFPRGSTPTDIDNCFNDFGRCRNLIAELKPWGIETLTVGQRLTLQTFVKQGNWVFIVRDPFWDQKLEYISDEEIVKVSPMPLSFGLWNWKELTVLGWKSIIHDFFDGGDFNTHLRDWGYPQVELQHYQK